MTGLDIADARVFAHGHPHAAYDSIRTEDPVHHVPSVDGRPPYWLLTRHADVQAVSRDNRRFTSTRGNRLLAAGGLVNLKPEIGAAVASTMLNFDPPQHAALRKPLDAAFLPSALRAVEDRIEAFVEGMMAGLEGQDEIEFVSQVAAIVPIRSLCLLLGIPLADEARILDWTNRLVGTSDPEYAATPELSEAAFDEVFAYGRALVDERRARPQDDLLSLVAQVEVDGCPLEGARRDGMFMLLLAAGNETTRNSLTGAILALSAFPEERAKLAADPALIGNAVEELQRFIAPVIQMMRVATEDVEIGGQTIRAGERVILLYGAANRDPAVFADPHRLDLARANANRQLSFGIGIHHCLGARLARMQLRFLLTALLRRYPGIHASGEPEHLLSNFVLGVKRLPVRLTG